MAYFGANLNLNLNSQYWLQLQNYQQLKQQKKPVGIFWDIENCCIPRGMNASILVENIRSFYSKFNLIENEFVVVCDVFGIHNNIITELNNMQVNIIHVCSFSKNACDEKLKQLMIRFVNTHGHDCAIILLSSDINFAPILTDIKNRIGAFVILFHHHQVSQSLLASSNCHYNYDVFCSSISGQCKNYQPPELDQIETTLSISNLPRRQDESQIRTLLNRITNNAGGRVININAENAQADVIFKCKSDAVRCHQRVNNRKFFGHTLKSKIESKVPKSVSNYRSKNMAIKNKICDESSSSSSSLCTVISAVSSQIQNINSCRTCISEKKSEYSNFLLKGKIFNVHISLEKLTKNLFHLLEIHSGSLPLNALPDCWLNIFEEELDFKTEPKILMEHLICCVSGVTIKNIEIELDGRKTEVKFIVFDDQTNVDGNIEIRKSNRMMELSLRIKSLLEEVSTKAGTTSFPSISLNEFESLYRTYFNRNLLLEIANSGCSSLIELLSLLKDKYNIYSYGQELILAYNLNGNIDRFVEDVDLELDNIQENIETSVIDIFDPSFYGFCYKDDLIDALFKHRSNSPILMNLKNILIAKHPFCQNGIAIKEFEKILPKLKEALMSMPGFWVELKDFHSNFQDMLQDKFNVFNFTYPQAFDLILNYSNGELEIVRSEDGFDLLVPNENLRMIEIGERIFRIFTEIATLIFGNGNRVTISIYQLLYHYQEQYSFLDFEIENVSKFFEKILVNLLKFEHSYCLIYTLTDTFLYRFDEYWRQDIICRIFFILFFEPKRSIDYKQLKSIFMKRLGYCFGVSFLVETVMASNDLFIISKTDDRKLLLEFGSKYELELMCLTVMLKHERIVFTQDQKPEWTVERLKEEIYDHYGIPMSDLNFDSFLLDDYLFEKNLESNAICFKRKDMITDVDLERIPNCNYCEKKEHDEAKINLENQINWNKKSTDFFILQSCC